jgi:hypothetical protein
MAYIDVLPQQPNGLPGELENPQKGPIMPRGSPKSSAGDTETAKATKPQRGTGTEPISALRRSFSWQRTSCAIARRSTR